MNPVRRIILLISWLLLPMMSIIGQQLSFYKDAQDVKIQHIHGSISEFGHKDAFLKSVTTSLTDTGYFDHVALQFVESDSQFKVTVKLGNRYVFGELNIVTDTDTLIVTRAGYFHADEINRWMYELVHNANINGYPFASAELLKIVPIADTKVDIWVAVLAGEFVRISGLRFQNTGQLSEHMLNRLAWFRKDTPYHPSVIPQIRRTLQSTGLLRSIDDHLLIQDGHEYYVYFENRELTPGNIDIIAGLSPGSENPGITGYASLALSNAILEASTLRMDYRRISGMDSQLDFKFRKYWILGFPIHSRSELLLSQRHDSYRRNVINQTVYYQYARYSRIGLKSSHSTTSGLQSDFMVNNMLFSDNRTLSIGLTFESNTTDHFAFARNGYIVRFDLMNHSKRLKRRETQVGQSDYNMYSALLESKVYFDIGPNLVLVPSINGAMLLSPYYFDEDLIRLGGTFSIRGYREEELTASSYVWGDSELRYLIDEYSYFFLFGAVGIYESPEFMGEYKSPGVLSRLTSGGFGLSYETRIGSIVVSYALARGDIISNGKIQFGIRNYF